MFCEHCGASLETGRKFCTNCGRPAPGLDQPSGAPPASVGGRVPAPPAPLPGMAASTPPRPATQGANGLGQRRDRRALLFGCGLASVVGVVVIAAIAWAVLTQTDILGKSDDQAPSVGQTALGAQTSTGGGGEQAMEASEVGSATVGQELESAASPTVAGRGIEESSLSQIMAGGEVQPLGVRQGLASLDSYRVRVTVETSGPAPDQFTSLVTDIRWNPAEDARLVHTESSEKTTDSEEIVSSVQDQFQIGLQTCQVDYDDEESYAEMEEMTALERDMLEATSSLFDLSITPQDPSFIGEETVSGIPTRHYSFRVMGLGDYSGAEVIQAGGEYWSAVDGNYLVKYTLTLETRTAPEGSPEAEAVRASYAYELLEVNQPQAIAFPDVCFIEEP